MLVSREQAVQVEEGEPTPDLERIQKDLELRIFERTGLKIQFIDRGDIEVLDDLLPENRVDRWGKKGRRVRKTYPDLLVRLEEDPQLVEDIFSFRRELKKQDIVLRPVERETVEQRRDREGLQALDDLDSLFDEMYPGWGQVKFFPNLFIQRKRGYDIDLVSERHRKRILELHSHLSKLVGKGYIMPPGRLMEGPVDIQTRGDKVARDIEALIHEIDRERLVAFDPETGILQRRGSELKMSEPQRIRLHDLQIEMIKLVKNGYDILQGMKQLKP